MRQKSFKTLNSIKEPQVEIIAADKQYPQKWCKIKPVQLRKKYVKQRILGNERSTKQNPTNEDKMGNVKIKTSHFPKERL